MSFLGEWHKQQKAIKDAERDNKKTATALLNKYRGCSIQDHDQQRSWKDAERDNKKNAIELMNNYQGGEHDIKGYEIVIIEEKKQKNSRYGFYSC